MHDLTKHRKEIEVVFDLNLLNWPIEDESFDYVEAMDVLEHLDNPLQAINEIHRILRPNGIFYAKCCGWKNPNFHIDLTHKHAFDVHSMDYIDPETVSGKEYGYYTERKWKILLAEEDRNRNPHFKLQAIK